MKSLLRILLIGCLCIINQPSFAVIAVNPNPVVEEDVKAAAASAVSDWENMTRKEKRAMKKKMKKELKAKLKEAKKAKRDADTDTLLLVIIGILLPPLAVFLVDGASTRFLISILLTLLFWLPGIIYAMIVIFG